jgi:hypothetical protein
MTYFVKNERIILMFWSPPLALNSKTISLIQTFNLINKFPKKKFSLNFEKAKLSEKYLNFAKTYWTYYFGSYDRETFSEVITLTNGLKNFTNWESVKKIYGKILKILKNPNPKMVWRIQYVRNFSFNS